MGKKESSLKNMLIALSLVSAISAFCVGSVYTLTKESIANAEKKKMEEALRAVLPSFDAVENITVNSADGEELDAYLASFNGEEVGVAINTFTKKGFSGEIRLMVGFLPNGSIYKVNVLSHSETPGLGSKMTDESFYSQFEGKTPGDFTLSVKKDGGDVDAITAATISSRAYCDAVDRAYNSYFRKGEKNEQ